MVREKWIEPKTFRNRIVRELIQREIAQPHQNIFNGS